MPLCSMTGFGQAEATTSIGLFRVEIRSVNNRFMEAQIRLPRSIATLEQDIKKELSAGGISRGSISVFVSWDREEATEKLTWNKDKVENYVRILKEIAKTHKIEGSISPANLLQISDIITSENTLHNPADVWKQLKGVVKKSIEDFQRSRQVEAELIVRDLKKMVAQIAADLKLVQKQAPERTKKYAEDLGLRIKKLTGDTAIDPQRLATEVALMADRLDVSEECTRLNAHITTLKETLNSNEPVGKRLNFILQEMNRETNTIGSKANDALIGQLSIALKENMEKMREQIQNIE